jgi:Mannosyl-glycoprotein endo-beta-N-acetylglucosaminidase
VPNALAKPRVEGTGPAASSDGAIGSAEIKATPGFEGELARRLQTQANPSASLAARHADHRSEVAAARTPLTGNQAASALAGAWKSVTGQAPSPKLLSVLTAQWAHETGRGEAMLNYNFGGIKGSAPSGLSATYRTHEGSGEHIRVITDHFRAYQSAAEGAVDYVRFLTSRYPAAIEAAKQGDATGFVHGLKQSGYFTDSEESYARSVSELARRAEREGFDSIGASSKPTPALLGAAFGPPTGTMPNAVAHFSLVRDFPGASPLVGDFPGASLAERAGGGLAIAQLGSATQGGALPFVDSSVLANEIAQAALRIAHSTPEDYLNELERLDTRTAT